MYEELVASRRHLRAVLDYYWQPSWRQRHNGHNKSPDDHLWRAANAIADILDTLDHPGPR